MDNSERGVVSPVEVGLDCSGLPSTSLSPKQHVLNSLSYSTALNYVKFCTMILAADFDYEDDMKFRRDVLTQLIARFRITSKDAIPLYELVGRRRRHSISSAKPAHQHEEDIFDNATLPDYIAAVKEDVLLAESLSHKASLVCDIISTTVTSTGNYDARLRVFARHVAALMGVEFRGIEMFEHEFADLLQHQVEEQKVTTPEDEAEQRKAERKRKMKRYALIGATGTIGGVVLGLTGGLAAPLFATAAGAIIGSAAAAGIATTAGAAVLGSLFGVAGAGFAGYKMSNRVGDIDEFQIEEMMNGQKSLNVVILISGWITEDFEDAFAYAWRHLDSFSECYCLRYESKQLVKLSNAMDYLTTMAVSYAIQSALMETALAGLVAAAVWPATLLSLGSTIDNPWSVCMDRAKDVGVVLAQLLHKRQHGKRPVTLMGFSVGARVIYHCLLELVRLKEHAGIVDDVILLGAPVSGSVAEWNCISQAVSGRIVNGYCRSDWLLRFLYRTMNAQFAIAGTGPVKISNNKIVNYDLTNIVGGHLEYREKLPEILAHMGIRVRPRRDTSNNNLARAAANFSNSNSPKRSSSSVRSSNVTSPSPTCNTSLS